MGDKARFIKEVFIPKKFFCKLSKNVKMQRWYLKKSKLLIYKDTKLFHKKNQKYLSKILIIKYKHF